MSTERDFTRASTAETKHTATGKHVQVDFGSTTWMGVVGDVRLCVETGQIEYLVKWGNHHQPSWVSQDSARLVDLTARRITRRKYRTSSNGSAPNGAGSSNQTSAGPSVPGGARCSSSASAGARAQQHPELQEAMHQYSNVPQFHNRSMPLHAYSSSMGVRGCRGPVGTARPHRIHAKLTPPARFKPEQQRDPLAKMARMLESTLL